MIIEKILRLFYSHFLMKLWYQEEKMVVSIVHIGLQIVFTFLVKHTLPQPLVCGITCFNLLAKKVESEFFV